MTLIIEDGSMPVGANSYGTVAGADAWHGLRRSPAWPAAPETGADPNYGKKEAALALACDYLNGLQWKGRKAAPSRIMAWPRMEVKDNDGYLIPSDVVPESVVQAQYYLAGVVFKNRDLLQPVLERGGRIASDSISGMGNSFFNDAANRDTFTALVDLLDGLVVSFDNTVKQRGASVRRVVLG